MSGCELSSLPLGGGGGAGVTPGVTLGVTSGATYFFVMVSDYQCVKCQV